LNGAFIDKSPNFFLRNGQLVLIWLEVTCSC